MSTLTVPPRLWTYWHSGEGKAPFVTRRCVAWFRQLNCGWEVRCLDASNAAAAVERAPPPGFDHLIHAHRFDWVRLAALARHGGVWLDSSIILFTPVSRWVREVADPAAPDLDDTVCGFAVPTTLHNDRPDDYVLENWALACRPSNPFVAAWLAEWEVAIAEGLEAYSRRVWYDVHPYLRGRPGPPQNFAGSGLPYLANFACWSIVRQRFAAAGRPARFAVRPSDRDGGPFVLLSELHWDSHAVAKTLCVDDVSCRHRWMCKLRGAERDLLETRVLAGEYEAGSTAVLQLDLPVPAAATRWRWVDVAVAAGLALVVVILWIILRRQAARPQRPPTP